MLNLRTIVLLTVLTAIQIHRAQAVSSSQIATCEFLFSREGSIAIRTQWPPTLTLSLAKSSEDLAENIRFVLLKGNLSVGQPPDVMLGEAVRFLKAQVALNGAELVHLWDLAIFAIRKNHLHWVAQKFDSLDRAFVYIGRAGPALVITQEGRFF